MHRVGRKNLFDDFNEQLSFITSAKGMAEIILLLGITIGALSLLGLLIFRGVRHILLGH